MALDRWIALIFLTICLAYGYTAWFTMDEGLPPIMQRNPIWPSTFPKLLSVVGLVTSLLILLGHEKKDQETGEIDYRHLQDYNVSQAVGLLFLMVLYAVSLKPIGFLLSTSLFLTIGAYILGERKWVLMIAISMLTAFSVWYLVSEILGIYMRPMPNASLLEGF